jgi:hypothetical protein
VAATQLRGGGLAVKLRFSRPVRKSGVVQTSTYQIRAAGPDGIYGNADDEPIPLGPVTYARASRSALIRLTATVADHAVQLIVNGGSIIGTNGKALVGNSGGAFVTTVTLA